METLQNDAIKAETFCGNVGFWPSFALFFGLDGMAWNRVCMESGRLAERAGGISRMVCMGSPVFGSVSIVRREGGIFGKRWIADFGF